MISWQELDPSLQINKGKRGAEIRKQKKNLSFEICSIHRVCRADYWLPRWLVHDLYVTCLWVIGESVWVIGELQMRYRWSVGECLGSRTFYRLTQWNINTTVQSHKNTATQKHNQHPTTYNQIGNTMRPWHHSQPFSFEGGVDEIHQASSPAIGSISQVISWHSPT